MIATILITLIVESPVVAIYAVRRRKPMFPILLTSVCGNLITQSLLWLILRIFFNQYLFALIVAEILIWILESLLLYVVRLNHLSLSEALLLSLLMNSASLASGWLLPV